MAVGLDRLLLLLRRNSSGDADIGIDGCRSFSRAPHANIARLQAYIKATETNLARAKEDLDVAVANRQAHLFGSP